MYIATKNGNSFKKPFNMNTSDIKNKILQGSKLAIKRLIDRKKKEDSYLIVSDQGKVVKVKASNIKM